MSTPLVTPFAGIFGQEASVISETGAVVSSVFDWTAIIAIIVYALLIAIVARGITRVES